MFHYLRRNYGTKSLKFTCKSRDSHVMYCLSVSKQLADDDKANLRDMKERFLLGQSLYRTYMYAGRD